MTMQTETPVTTTSTIPSEVTIPVVETPSSEIVAAPVVETPKVESPVIASAIETPAKVEAPVEEEYDLELSEDSPLTVEELNEIAEAAGRLGLSKVDAEKLISDREKAYKAGTSKSEAAYQAKIDASRKQIESDPDFQGDKKLASFASIDRAVKAFGDDELVALLNTPEVGNSLVIARFLKRLGDNMADDTLPGKGVIAASADKGNETLKNLYPSFFENK
jgi:hypothetical protein